jgi:hypothetical protein
MAGSQVCEKPATGLAILSTTLVDQSAWLCRNADARAALGHAQGLNRTFSAHAQHR